MLVPFRPPLFSISQKRAAITEEMDWIVSAQLTLSAYIEQAYHGIIGKNIITKKSAEQVSTAI